MCVPKAVAEAAIKTGVARRPLDDLDDYELQLSGRLDPTTASLQTIFEKVKSSPKRVVFAEGEEETTIRAAHAFQNAGYGVPILVGREELVYQSMENLGLSGEPIEVQNARLSNYNLDYRKFLYGRLQRKGKLLRDCQRMVNQNRNVFAACMVACGHADALVTGLTRGFGVAFTDISRALDPKEGHRAFGLTIIVARDRTVFLADSTVHELPDAEQLVDIAIQSAAQARAMGHEPRVAFLSFSNFGNPPRREAEHMRQAVELLDGRQVDFEYDGEMQANVALDHNLLRQLYPFCRLSGAANVLIMPGLHSANIAYKLIQKIGGGSVIGPLLLGLSKPAQVVPIGATVNDLVTAAALAAYESIEADVST